MEKSRIGGQLLAKPIETTTKQSNHLSATILMLSARSEDDRKPPVPGGPGPCRLSDENSRATVQNVRG